MNQVNGDEINIDGDEPRFVMKMIPHLKINRDEIMIKRDEINISGD